MTLPVLVGVLVSYTLRPIYEARYTAGVALAFYVVVALGVRSLRPVRLRQILTIVLVLGLLAPLPGYYAAKGPHSWDRATASVEAGVDGDDLVVISDHFAEVPFRYRWDRDDVRVVTVAQSSSRKFGIDSRYDRVRAGQIDDVAGSYDDVWLILAYTTPEHDRTVLDRVGSEKEQIESDTYPPITVYRFGSRESNVSG